MKTKRLALGGAATLALACMVSFMPVPGFAQTSSQDNGAYGTPNNPPQYSSPAEKAQTRALNENSTSGTTESPSSLNGETPPAPMPSVVPPPAPPPAPQASNAATGMQLAQNTDAQQQYQQQQQQYQQQQQDYQQKQGQYDDQKGQYDRNVRHYDQARWNYTDYPTSFAYRYDDGPHLMRLYLVAEPSQQLANAPVEGPSGAWVGRVRNVEAGPDGSPRRIEIALNHRVSVWVEPGNLRFDADDHVVFTNLTRDQLWDSPGATIESDRS